MGRKARLFFYILITFHFFFVPLHFRCETDVDMVIILFNYFFLMFD